MFRFARSQTNVGIGLVFIILFPLRLNLVHGEALFAPLPAFSQTMTIIVIIVLLFMIALTPVRIKTVFGILPVGRQELMF